MLSLSDEHKSHLAPLVDQPPQLLQDFCRLAIDFLKRGPNLKLYSTAAQKLQVDVNVIQLAVEGLVHLIVKSRQHNVSVTRSLQRDAVQLNQPKNTSGNAWALMGGYTRLLSLLSKLDFRDLVLTSGFNEEQEFVLNELHDSHKVDVDLALTTLVPSLFHYHELEWRFNVQVASRSLLRQTLPALTIKLTLKEIPQVGEETKYKHFLLETDPNNLKHLIQKLDEALVEASSQHSRRLQRIFK